MLHVARVKKVEDAEPSGTRKKSAEKEIAFKHGHEG